LVGVREEEERVEKKKVLGVQKRVYTEGGRKPKEMVREGVGDGWMDGWKLLWWSAGQTELQVFQGLAEAYMV
jgi:hypothetical protein